MYYNTLIENDIFPIEIIEGKNSGKWIIYLPLVRHAETVSFETLQLLAANIAVKTSLTDETVDKILNRLNDECRKIYYTSCSVDGLLNLMILPNNVCNFQCSYCYSAQGRSNVEIPLDKLKAGIRYFFNPERSKGERLTVSVLGGGEPFLSWTLLKQALEYTYKMNSLRDSSRNIPLSVSIVTNGSIINEDILKFCRQQGVNLSVSFDILEDVQNKQRDKYTLVRYNINKFAGQGIDVAINTVITQENVQRMEEMIDTSIKTIPEVKKIGLKPIISNNYFHSLESRTQYYHDFVDNFFKAKRIAEQHNMYLTCSYLNTVICLADRYCPGKFVITAEGSISTCHCVSSVREPLYDKFIFGTITDGGEVIINHDKLKTILCSNVHSNERCSVCFAKWHCAGGCYADKCNINEENHQAYCESMRRFLSLFLQEYFNL